jgi:asparagine synthase (glutamine-hydrolysing)
MCGIAGFAGMARVSIDPSADVRRMCAAIRHRGPDGDGFLCDGPVALGMRRLSVIDVGGGWQPIGNEDDSIQVVFNGEIYNFRALRADLERRGHRFRTHSDTEVLVHLYEEHGDALVQHLRGMYSFALWDKAKRRLLLVRDRLGIKPLNYAEIHGGLVFGSELRSLLALPWFVPRVSDRALALFLAFGYVPDPDCIFEGVRKLPPGHLLIWSESAGIAVERYWSPVTDEISIGEGEAVSRLRELLDESVLLHLESDVPLGAFLSGGLDSSTVVALMARATSRPVKTFSIGFQEALFDEAPDARRVAEALGTEHTELIVTPDVDALFERVVESFDEPFGDSSAIPTYLVSKLARQDVTVALSGDGGDELLGGYTRHLELLARQEWSPRLRPLLRSIGRSLPHSTPGRNRILDWARSRRGRYATTVVIPPLPEEGGVLRPELARHVGALDAVLEPWFDQAASRDWLTQLTLVDFMTFLPGDILTKVDRTSMAVSLEARVPLLDHKLVEFGISLPASLKVRDGTGKYLLRRAVQGIVPDSVLTKPKQGFAVPISQWFRRELRPRVDDLTRIDSRVFDYCDRAEVARVIREHQGGRRAHGAILWRLLVLDLWLDALARGVLARPSSALPN